MQDDLSKLTITIVVLNWPSMAKLSQSTTSIAYKVQTKTRELDTVGSKQMELLDQSSCRHIRVKTVVIIDQATSVPQQLETATANLEQ